MRDIQLTFEMNYKRLFEQVVFVFGTFVTCLIILAASNLQAQTLLQNQLKFLTQLTKTVEPLQLTCEDTTINARNGLLVIEEMLDSVVRPTLACRDSGEGLFCPTGNSPNEILLNAETLIQTARYTPAY